MITAGELLRRFRAAMSENDADYFTDQNAYDWMNEAQAVIYTDAPFSLRATWELDSTNVPPGTSIFLLPEDCAIPTAIAVRRSSGSIYRLNYIEPDRMDRLTTGGTSGAGEPRAVTYRIVDDGPAFEVFPRFSASASIYIEGQKAPTDLAAEDDVSDLPRELTTAVVLYAVARAKYKDEESQQYTQAMQAFGDEMRKLGERRMQYHADQHNTVRDRRPISTRFGGWWRGA